MKNVSTRIFIILGLFVLLIALIAIPNILEGPTRQIVAKTLWAMRDVERALEAYYADHHAYPPMAPLREYANDPRKDLASTPFAVGWDAHVTALEKADGLDLFTISSALTTPVPYLKALPPDPCINDQRLAPYLPAETRIPFAYYVYNNEAEPGWMLISPGPDGDYDLINPPEVYDPARKLISRKIRRYRYDPAYGIQSTGDIFRFKHQDKAFEWNR